MADLTTAELARLRVQLSQLPGLDPAGLPTPRRKHTGILVSPALYFAPDDGAVYLAGADPEVDFADAATRDRAARWLAGRMDVPPGCTAPRFGPHEVLVHGCRTPVRGSWWLLAAPRCGVAFQAFASEVSRHRHIRTLAAVDCDDDRRLDDRSRWVDALALALCCVAVGGEDG